MNDAVEILAASRAALRQDMKLAVGLIVEALVGGTDNELRPVLSQCHTVTALIERHLEKVGKVNAAVGQSSTEVVPFPKQEDEA